LPEWLYGVQLDHLDSRLAANLLGGSSHQVLSAYTAQISCILAACLLGGSGYQGLLSRLAGTSSRPAPQVWAWEYALHFVLHYALQAVTLLLAQQHVFVTCGSEASDLHWCKAVLLYSGLQLPLLQSHCLYVYPIVADDAKEILDCVLQLDPVTASWHRDCWMAEANDFWWAAAAKKRLSTEANK